MTQHTPGPWEAYDCEPEEQATGAMIFAEDGTEDGRLICTIAKSKRVQPDDKRRLAYSVLTEEDAANAEFIVRAVNCHEDLLAAAVAIVETQPHFQKPGSAHKPGSDVYRRYEAGVALRAAIAKAKGE